MLFRSMAIVQVPPLLPMWLPLAGQFLVVQVYLLARQSPQLFLWPPHPGDRQPSRYRSTRSSYSALTVASHVLVRRDVGLAYERPLLRVDNTREWQPGYATRRAVWDQCRVRRDQAAQ